MKSEFDEIREREALGRAEFIASVNDNLTPQAQVVTIIMRPCSEDPGHDEFVFLQNNVSNQTALWMVEMFKVDLFS
jgi:hypothetical protein